MLFFALTLIFLIVVYRKKQREYHRKNVEMQESFKKELLHAQLESQEQTFKTLSQELHDNIGQVLSLAKFNISVYEMTPAGAGNDHIAQTKVLLNNAISDLRNISRMLHTDYIKDKPLEESVRQELDALEHTRQFATKLEIVGTPFDIDAERRLILFRIIQECMSNIVKHAAASVIEVMLMYDEAHITINIRDNGQGFDTGQTHAGIGIRNMTNRTQLISGQIEIRSTKGSGTSVVLRIDRTTAGH